MFIDTIFFLPYQDINAMGFYAIYDAEEIAVVIPRVIFLSQSVELKNNC